MRLYAMYTSTLWPKLLGGPHFFILWVYYGFKWRIQFEANAGNTEHFSVICDGWLSLICSIVFAIKNVFFFLLCTWKSPFSSILLVFLVAQTCSVLLSTSVPGTIAPTATRIIKHGVWQLVSQHKLYDLAQQVLINNWMDISRSVPDIN